MSKVPLINYNSAGQDDGQRVSLGSTHNLDINIENRSTMSSRERRPNQPYRNESQILLDNFMTKFKEDVGSEQNQRSNVVGDAKKPDAEPVKEGERQYSTKAAADAADCKSIQTLDEFLDQQKHLKARAAASEQVDVKSQFFKLQNKFFKGKFILDKDEIIELKGYTGEPSKRSVISTQMEVITTNKGCIPVIKTMEYLNTQNNTKYVKLLKIFDVASGKISKQIIVDQNSLYKRFRNFETSLLHFENSIVFYKREDTQFVLTEYNAATNQEREVPGYRISEEAHGIHYHVMFSREFGAEQKSNNLVEFLSHHYVFCQAYKVEESNDCKVMSLVGYQILQNPEGGSRLAALNPSQGHFQVLQQPIQHVCHIINQHNKEANFIAFDCHNQHHFNVDQQRRIFSMIKTYHGNNETHMQTKISEAMNSGQVGDDDLHKEGGQFSPFFKHDHPQFIILKESVEYTVKNKKKPIEQYFTLNNDNQYMLIYPNYNNIDNKREVIEQIAEKHQYSQSNDSEYDYQEEYLTRMEDFRSGKYKKVSHVSSNSYSSCNQMKKTSHIKEVLTDQLDLAQTERVLLTTDQKQNIVYIYQATAGPGEFRIRYFKFMNTQSSSWAATTLPKQVNNIQNKLVALYGEQKHTRKMAVPNQTFYINSKFKDVVSHSHFIMTNKQERSTTNTRPDLCHFIGKDLKDQFILIERPDSKSSSGFYMTLRVKSENNEDQIQLQMYTKNKGNHLFFFSLINEKEKLDKKHTYFVIKKPSAELEKYVNIPLISWETEVTSFFENPFDAETEAGKLQAYTKTMTYKDLLDRQSMTHQDWLVNLTFEKVMDLKDNIDFLPIIYQEKAGYKSHHLIIFDLHKMRVVKHQNLLSNMSIRSRLRVSTTGFGLYSLTRTSEVYNTNSDLFTIHSCGGQPPSTQDVKYQISAQYYNTDIELPENYDDQDEALGLNPAQGFIELREFSVRYNCCENNSIKFVGMKYILPSVASTEQRKKTFTDCLFVPFLDSQGNMKGSQFILKEDEGMRSLRLLDQDLNTIYQHQSDTIQYGLKKFFTDAVNQEEFIVVASSQLRQRLYVDEFFDISQAYWVNHKALKKLLSMHQAKFENWILNDDFDQLQQEQFYHSQESLEGKTLNDLSLTYSREVSQGLSQDPQEIAKINGSILQEACNADETILQMYMGMQLGEKNLFISQDFNFVSTTRYAAELNENQSVGVILEKIFDLNSIDYQDIFMMELPVMLRMPRIDRIYDFLNRDYAEAKEIEKQNQESLASGDKQIKAGFLNFEDFLNHPFLPPFLSVRESYHAKVDFEDYHNTEQEIINEIVHKNPYMTWNVQTYKDGMAKRNINATLQKLQMGKREEKNIEVEHSAIDFQKVVIGDKIRGIQEKKYTKVNFNDNHLADIFFVEDEDYIDFYNCDAVRKVIDFQFQRTKNFLQGCFFIYLFGFMIPFLFSLSVKDEVFLNLMFCLCMVTQVFFISFEFAQLKEQKLEYFKDPWNLLDSSQFAFFTLLFVIKIGSQFKSDTLFEIVIVGLLLFQSFNKVFYFIRIYEPCSYIFTITTLIIGEMIPFIFFCSILILGICKMYQSMHMGINDPTGEFNDFSSNFLKFMIQSYKSNMGDINVPILDVGMQNRVKETVFAGFMIFGMNISVWAFQQSFFIFIGVMFTIQVINNMESFNAEMPTRMYKVKAQFNNETFDIMDIFLKQRTFKVICFAMDKRLKMESYEQWNGFSNAIDIQIMKQDYEQNQEREDQAELLTTRSNLLVETKDVADDMQYQLAELTEKLRHYRRCCCDEGNNAGNSSQRAGQTRLRQPSDVHHEESFQDFPQSQNARSSFTNSGPRTEESGENRWR